MSEIWCCPRSGAGSLSLILIGYCCDIDSLPLLGKTIVERNSCITHGFSKINQVLTVNDSKPNVYLDDSPCLLQHKCQTYVAGLLTEFHRTAKLRRRTAQFV